MFCSDCGTKLGEFAKFCPSCGKARAPEEKVNSKGNYDPESLEFPDSEVSLTQRFKELSTRGKIFYSLWGFINFLFILDAVKALATPADPFHFLCAQENLNCAPTPPERLGVAIVNLLFWNLFFYGILYFTRRRRARES